MENLLLSGAAHSWLSRVTYGVNESLVRNFLSLENTDLERWKKYIALQLSQAHPKDEAVENKVAKLNLKVLDRSLLDLWREQYLSARAMRVTAREKQTTDKEEIRAASKERRNLELEPVLALETASWIRIVESPWQLHERLVEFWHDHFNIFGFERRTASGTLVLNRDTIRPLAFGNFRVLLGEVCRNPAMLYYLDNAYNQSGNPNENFARELFELHTLGAENYLGTLDRERVTKNANGTVVGYVDGDVYEAARAFTGWRVSDGSYGIEKNSGEFVYHEPWHDRFQKIVLGQKIPEHQAPMKDGNDVLNFLCAHPGTAKHLMRKFCRRFVSDNPPEKLVERLAEFWLARRDSPTQIKETLFELFCAPEFLEEKIAKFKRPVDFFASLLRLMSSNFSPSEKFIQATQRSGHCLFGWKTPDGPPDTAATWQSPQSLIDRWKTAQQIIKQEIPGCEIQLPESLKGKEFSPEALVAQITRALFFKDVDKDFMRILATFAAGGRRLDAPLPAELVNDRALIIAELCILSPDFQVRS